MTHNVQNSSVPGFRYISCYCCLYPAIFESWTGIRFRTFKIYLQDAGSCDQGTTIVEGGHNESFTCTILHALLLLRYFQLTQVINV